MKMIKSIIDIIMPIIISSSATKSLLRRFFCSKIVAIKVKENPLNILYSLQMAICQCLKSILKCLTQRPEQLNT